MFEYIKNALTVNYTNFDGRARREEYWYFILFRLIVTLPFTILGETGAMINLGISLILIIPSIAVTIRRMHDVGKSGWYMLIPIYNIILCFTDSQPGENEYGPNPKGIGNTEDADDLIQSIGQ